MLQVKSFGICRLGKSFKSSQVGQIAFNIARLGPDIVKAQKRSIGQLGQFLHILPYKLGYPSPLPILDKFGL